MREQIKRFNNWLTSPDALCVGVLLFLSVAFFAPAVFTGTIPSGFDAFYDVTPWQYMEDASNGPRNPLLLDEVRQFHPWRHFTAKTLSNGHVPFWNPHNGAGAPFMANHQSGVFYPLNYLFWLFPVPGVYLVFLVLKLFLCALLTYAFLRRLGNRPFYSLFGSVAFGFSGFITLFVYSPITGVAILLPGLFLGLHLLREKQTFPRISFLALLVAVQFFGGHVETSFHLAIAAGSYLVFLFFEGVHGQERDNKWRFFGWVLVSVALGTLIASIQLVPLWEYLQHSRVYQKRMANGGERFGFGLLPFLSRIPMLVFPGMFGSPIGGSENYVGAFFGIYNYTEMNGAFIGVFPFLITLVSFPEIQKHRGHQYFWGMLGFGLLMSFHIPVIGPAVNELPFFDVSDEGRLDLLVAFAAAVLACKQLQTEGVRNRYRRIISWLIPVSLTVLFAVLLSYYFFYEEIYQYLLETARQMYIEDQGGAGHRHPWSYWKNRIPFYLDLARNVATREILVFSGVSILGYYLLGMEQSSEGWWRKGAMAGLVLLVFFDLFRVSGNYMTPLAPAKNYPETESTRLITNQANKGRVLGLDRSFLPNTNLVYGWDDIRHHDAINVNRYVRFLHITGNWKRHGSFEMGGWKVKREDLLDYLNVSIIAGETRLSGSRYRELMSSPVSVYRNTEAKDRYFLSSRWRNCRSSENVWEALEEGTNPCRKTLLEEPPEFHGGDRSKTGIKQSSVTWKRDGPNRVQVQVRTPEKTLLVGSETHYPGWTATVNGEPVEVLRANGAFRAIGLAPGKHRIVFSYRPSYWYLLVGLSLVGLLLLLSGFVAGLRTLFAGRIEEPSEKKHHVR